MISSTDLRVKTTIASFMGNLGFIEKDTNDNAQCHYSRCLYFVQECHDILCSPLRAESGSFWLFLDLQAGFCAGFNELSATC